MKQKYMAPDVNVEFLEESDVLTLSTMDGAYDGGNVRWGNDIFF